MLYLIYLLIQAPAHKCDPNKLCCAQGRTQAHSFALPFFALLALLPIEASAFLFGALSTPAAFFLLFGGGCLASSLQLSSASSSALTGSCAHSPYFSAMQTEVGAWGVLLAICLS